MRSVSVMILAVGLEMPFPTIVEANTFSSRFRTAFAFMQWEFEGAGIWGFGNLFHIYWKLRVWCSTTSTYNNYLRVTCVIAMYPSDIPSWGISSSKCNIFVKFDFDSRVDYSFVFLVWEFLRLGIWTGPIVAEGGGGVSEFICRIRIFQNSRLKTCISDETFYVWPFLPPSFL